MITQLYRRYVPASVRDYVYKVFLGEALRRIRLKKHVLKLIHSDIDNVPEKKEYIRYLRRNFLRSKSLGVIFPSPFVEKYLKMSADVYYDIETSLYYTLFHSKRLYWKRGMKKDEIMNSFIRLQAEQDPMSPHRYFDDDFNYHDKVLFDVGAAEGIVVLEHIDEIRHAYLFECDEGWSEALCHTFRPYSHKITVIPKYVSDKSSDSDICIDDFVEQTDIVPDIVKMDIEGYEEKALKGAERTLAVHHPFVTCCLYHLPDAEEKIVANLSSFGYRCNVTPFYMFPVVFIGSGAPYLRHGTVIAY